MTNDHVRTELLELQELLELLELFIHHIQHILNWGLGSEVR